jgi:hypothetical protein
MNDEVNSKMALRREYIDEIEEIRERTGHPDWDNGITKLFLLSQRVRALETEGEELGYYPVAAIAAIESYFRWEIRRLVDSGDPRYVNNVRLDKLQLKLDHRVLFALHGKRVTVGELIAHSVRLSSVDAIGETMSQLLGDDFFVLVKDARDPWERRELGDNASRVIHSGDETFQVLKRCFEVRNIICHEAHLWSPLRIPEIKQICSVSYDFARASYFAIGFHRNPHSPLTLEESLQAASERVKSLDAEITSLENEIAPAMPPQTQEAFTGMQDAWREFVKRQGWFYGSQQMNMTRGVLHEKLVAQELGQARLAELKSLRKANTPILGANEAPSK